MRLRHSKRHHKRSLDAEHLANRSEALVEAAEAREGLARLLGADSNWNPVPASTGTGPQRGTLSDLASVLSERVPKLFEDVMPAYCTIQVVKVEADDDVGGLARHVRVHLKVSAG